MPSWIFYEAIPSWNMSTTRLPWELSSSVEPTNDEPSFEDCVICSESIWEICKSTGQVRMHLNLTTRYGTLYRLRVCVTSSVLIFLPKPCFDSSLVRFEDGKDGPLNPSNSICRLDLHSWKQPVFCISTRKDSVLWKTFTTFCKSRTNAESKTLNCHRPRPSSWPSTTSNSLPCFGSRKIISSMPLRGTSTTLFAKNTTRE